MVACNIDHSGATLGMSQNSAYHIGVALFPAPAILLYLPCIYDIAYEIQCIAGVVFEKIVQGLGFAVLGAKVNVRDKD